MSSCLAADGALSILRAENIASADAATTGKSLGEWYAGSELLQVSGELVLKELGGRSCDDEGNSEGLDFHNFSLFNK